MADDPRDPSLENVLELMREVTLDGVRVMLPGRITTYDPVKQRASVQPLVKHRHVAEDGETIVAEVLPVIHDCPVVFCGTSRGRITWPVAAGDTCEIRFASSSISSWVASGGIVDPGDDRHHDLSDAVVFVGLHDFAHVPTDAPTDALVVHATGGTVIKLGSSSASQAVVVQSALGDFMAALAAAIPGAGVGAGALTSLQTQLGLLNGGTGWKARTSKVKAE
jgi:hypothetical protein